MLRIVLFVLTNLAVMALLTIIVKLTGIDVYAQTRGGLDLRGLLILAAVMGMGGSFISLATSKWVAKMSVGAKVIEQPRNPSEAWLLETVRRHAEKAGIGMPEVALYEAPEMNAFATGMSKDHALVAVSTGLLGSMDRSQVEAVLGHEITHVANGDMVTMALLQGVLNTFVIFLARVIGAVVDRTLSGNRDNGGGGFAYYAIVVVLQIVLGLLASLIVLWFSRWREFRADAGGARLAGRGAMISALERLAANHGESTLPNAIQAFGISGERGWTRLLMSHPPIPERIAALRAAT